MKAAGSIAVLLALIALLAACRDSAPDSVPAPTLEPPVAESPASGACAPVPEGDVVTITIHPDVPDPRCARITPSQQVRVVNETAEAVRVKLADLEVSVSPGEEWLFNVPIGTYFGLGVHVLEVSSLSGGAELLVVQE